MRAIDYFDKGAEAVPDRIAIIDGGTRLTYREAREITFKIARAMRANGLRGEEPAGILSHNDAYVASTCATAGAFENRSPVA